jgi:2-iminobutanoate/2-iminopropanoate deaminase
MGDPPTPQPVATPEAPAAIGPYSQAVAADRLVFLAGQVAIDPAIGALVPGGIEAETHQVMRNLTAVLAAAGSSWDRVVKTTVYLADLHDFPAMNAIYATYLGVTPPARSTVQVARLPRDARVEIDAIALRV